MGKKFRQSSTESKKEVFAIKIRIFKSKTGRSFWGDLINFLFLALLGIIMLIPVIFSVSNAFKPLDELFVFPPRFFVRNPTLDNFTILPSLFSDSLVPLSRYMLNTVFITVVGTAGSIIIASMAAYVLEKKKFKARDMIFNIIVNTLLFTPTVTAIPNFLIMSKLGFINSYAAILIPVIGSSLNVFLMKQFMVGIPNTILEAARIDGSGEQRIFWSIVMPSVKPAWMTLIIFSIQNLWGVTGGNYIYSEELKTLPYALSQVMSAGLVRAGASAAIATLMMIVPICVFIVTQSNIMETMMSSGIKE